MPAALPLLLVAAALAVVTRRHRAPPGRYFSWSEVYDGQPRRADVDAAATKLARSVLDPLRDAVGGPLHVSSWYRSPERNAATPGASSTSQHLTGEAADVWAAGFSARELADLLDRLELPFDQLIAYTPERGGHVHVSLSADGRQRGELRWAGPAGGYTPVRSFA